jgi:hypothetical protein
VRNLKFHTSFHQFSVLYDWFTDFPVCWDMLMSAWNNSIRTLEYHNCSDNLPNVNILKDETNKFQDHLKICILFLSQAAADPEHPNKCICTPFSHPLTTVKFWIDGKKKKWKSCRLSGPKFYEIKIRFIDMLNFSSLRWTQVMKM